MQKKALISRGQWLSLRGLGEMLGVLNGQGKREVAIVELRMRRGRRGRGRFRWLRGGLMTSRRGVSSRLKKARAVR